MRSLPIFKRLASQPLMMDWRVPPSLSASLSKLSIIQMGKSTFTRLCRMEVNAVGCLPPLD